MGTGRPALSVMFFSGADSGRGGDRYTRILELTRLADDLGFEAVWLPERHFHPFGGLFPRPAVLAAAVAAQTRRIGVRAGSVVAPLHAVAHIAEEWAMVDALSGGRAGLSLATGWNRGDFADAHCDFEQRREYTFAAVETLRRLWQGGEVKTADGLAVSTFPRPVQPELPLWLTATSGPATFEEAGRQGCSVLTAFLQLDRATLEQNIGVYRRALAEHAPGTAPRVTVMMHTCVAGSQPAALAAAEGPLVAYQRQFLDLNDRAAEPRTALSPAEKRELARYAAGKYAAERGLVGGPDEVAERLADLATIGVDEVACLLDFGLPDAAVTETLHRLAPLTR